MMQFAQGLLLKNIQLLFFLSQLWEAIWSAASSASCYYSFSAAVLKKYNQDFCGHWFFVVFPVIGPLHFNLLPFPSLQL